MQEIGIENTCAWFEHYFFHRRLQLYVQPIAAAHEFGEDWPLQGTVRQAIPTFPVACMGGWMLEVTGTLCPDCRGINSSGRVAGRSGWLGSK